MSESRREVTPEDVLRVFDEREDAAEPLTAPEIADIVGVARRTALNRLNELRERGDIVSKKVGGRARVWWVPNKPDAPAAPLKRLVGMLDENQANAARERSEEWGEEFDRQMRPDTGEP